MPAEYRIDEGLGCVFSWASGRLTSEELFEHQRQMTADPSFRADLKQRWDFLELTEVQVSAEDVRMLAEANQFDRQSRRAVVVDSPVAFGLIRMFMVYSDIAYENAEVFGNCRDADAWLGIAPTEP